MAGGITGTRGNEREAGGPETDESQLQTDVSQTDESQTDETRDNAPVLRSRNDRTIPTCALWTRIDSPIYAYSEATGSDQVSFLSTTLVTAR